MIMIHNTFLNIMPPEVQALIDYINFKDRATGSEIAFPGSRAWLENALKPEGNKTKKLFVVPSIGLLDLILDYERISKLDTPAKRSQAKTAVSSTKAIPLILAVSSLSQADPDLLNNEVFVEYSNVHFEILNNVMTAANAISNLP